MEQPVWVGMVTVDKDLIDVGTEMAVHWDSGSQRRAVTWPAVSHPPGGVPALPHPRLRGAGRELSLRPGLPEAGAQVGRGGGGGRGGIWSRGKPRPDRWPHQNRF